MQTISIASLDFTPVGRLWCAATEHGICSIALAGGRRGLIATLPADARIIEEDAPFRSLACELARFAAGRRARFDLPLDVLGGTPFQRRVWRAIARIPWGETRSYAWLAKQVRRPRAVRAVAQACGANPTPIVVPCHRVIASDGTIGGFSSGIAKKRALLQLEEMTL